jgi:hypothetical protein
LEHVAASGGAFGEASLDVVIQVFAFEVAYLEEVAFLVEGEEPDQSYRLHPQPHDSF